MLISACYNIGEVAVHAEFHQGSKPMKCVRGDARCRLDGDLQQVVIGMEDGHWTATSCSCRWSTTTYRTSRPVVQRVRYPRKWHFW
jgi:hypothetical protein